MDDASFLSYGVFSFTEGMKTGLVCPACGCDDNGPIEMHDRQTTRKMMKNPTSRPIKINLMNKITIFNPVIKYLRHICLESYLI